MADQVHEAEVFVAVGVEVTQPQVDLMTGGELLHAARLGGAPDHRLLDFAGHHSLVVGHESVAHDVLDAKVARHRRHLIGQGGRAQHHGVAAALMGPDQLAHFRVDQVRHGLPEDALSHLVDIPFRPPLDGAGTAFDQSLECAPSEPELHCELHDRQKLGHPEIPAAHPVPRLGRGCIPGNQRPVQVEERADTRALRARVDFRHRLGESRRREILGGAHGVRPTLPAFAAADRPAGPRPRVAGSIP